MGTIGGLQPLTLRPKGPGAPDPRITELAHTPVLLIACDYDGTLAPIVEDPAAAYPVPEAVAGLRALASLPDTYAAVISGRALRDLAVLSRLPSEIHLVGSHGSEFDLGFAASLPAEQLRLLERVQRELAALAATAEGAWVERKPASAALHVRNCRAEDQSRLCHAAMQGPGRLPGVHSRQGKKVVELLVVPTDKGYAVDRLRHQVGASAVLFVGDDVTDEDAFRSLHGPDVGVKVGEGETVAGVRVDSSYDVAVLLARLHDLRSSWLSGTGAVPIEEHSLLSDLRTVAIAGPDATITWMCAPRIDSAAVFASLVGGTRAGLFRVQPATGAHPLGQRYLDETLVLETRWPGLRVVDYLDCADGLPDMPAGVSRLVRVITGSVPARLELAPRLEFGRLVTTLEPTADGLRVHGGHDHLLVRSPGVTWTIEPDGVHQRAVATVAPTTGSVVVELLVGNGAADTPVDEATRRAATMSFWRSWAARLDLPSTATSAVLRSALVLKSLCHGPTGAIVAAGTTSLPEDLGGVRNWDYRYCWIRDASLAAAALARLGSTGEALAFLEWLVRVSERAGGPARLRPLYTVEGHDLNPEAVIAELSGYAGSRPVRIGNLADHQVQLDVFGPVAELLWLLVERGETIAPAHAELLEGMVAAVAARAHEPDHGIWEARHAPRHHVHSKVMCWATVDRAIKVAEARSRSAPGGWVELRDALAEEVLSKGWKPERNAYGKAYDGDDVDAASLSIGLTGLLPPDDPRFAGTIHAVETHLRRGPIVYRYLSEDGLPGREGGFLLCGFWLADAYALSGRTDEARWLFEQLVALSGPTGLLSEEYDPDARVALGNVPQTYSHHGLIDTALRLSALG